MASTRTLGARGEEIAANHLKRQGIEILVTHYRFERAEIDIVGNDHGILVFCEVKARREDTFGAPEYAITVRKQAQIRKAASGYLYEHGIRELQCRFDVVAVDLTGDRAEIRHYKDAFR